MMQILTGIENFITNYDPSKYQGNIGLVCHSASVDRQFNHTIDHFLRLFPGKLTKLFGPQHGLVTDVQDNMIESNHFTHPHYQLPVYSLYSETRIPTDEMLADLDYLFIDLQDVGTRIYTYIYTVTYILEACAGKDIKVVILDRPNPLGLDVVEGNVLEAGFESFVGRHPLPVRHGLSIGEVALMHQQYWANEKCQLEIVPMTALKRKMLFQDLDLPWVLPSPNLPTLDGAFTFAGTVLFEGTNISEGRGTTRSLEIIGHPSIDPHKLLPTLEKTLAQANLKGFKLRPLYFMPTFQKHQGVSCGGYQLHITDYKSFKPWRVSQLLCKLIQREIGDAFEYNKKPYEYEFDRLSIDLINGTDKLRHWYEKSEINESFLENIEAETLPTYLEQKNSIALY